MIINFKIFEKKLYDKYYITVTYNKIIPDDDYINFEEEHGWENKEGISMFPDNFELEENITVFDKTIDFLQNEYGTTTPSSNIFQKGIYYSTIESEKLFTSSDETYYSIHLNGFTEEEEHYIYDIMQKNIQKDVPLEKWRIIKKIQEYNL